MGSLSRLVVFSGLSWLGSACKNDNDCSLLGECVAGKCHCDPGWKGETCNKVDLLPVKRNGGYRNDTMASWCGSATKVGDTYHYFGSAMSGQCELHNYFATNSMSIRATSKSPAGPYEFQEVVMPEFSHSTAIKRAPDGKFVMVTIGKDMRGENVHDCTKTSLQKEPYDPEPLGPHDYVRIHTADSVEGPWKTRVIMQSDPTDPLAWNCNKSNPAPLFFPNGSILLMYRGQTCDRVKGCRNATSNRCQAQGIAYAENYDAEFVDRTPDIKELRGNEDAFFWQSKRGFHALFHSKNACGQSQEEVDICGGLAWSRDSYSWTYSSEPVYEGEIEWENDDGTVTKDTLVERERPNIFFAEDGVTPLYLINGAGVSATWQFSLFAPFNVEANRAVVV